jgi:hypothetical protein
VSSPRQQLAEILERGLSDDPLSHAEQVARIAGILHAAFAAAGLRSTLVGGSAIEVHAPGIYRSGDLDLVIERAAADAGRAEDVFTDLGFERFGRHWRRQRLFVEVPGSQVIDPSELMRVADAVFRVVTKEVVLADRVVGFKQWLFTAYGQQAIDMLAAFGDQLDMAWLRPRLEYEDSYDAFEALQRLAASASPVSHSQLTELTHRLKRPLPPPRRSDEGS